MNKIQEPLNIWPFNENDRAKSSESSVKNDPKNYSNIEFLVNQNNSLNPIYEDSYWHGRESMSYRHNNNSPPKKLKAVVRESKTPYQQEYFALPEEFRSHQIFRSIYSRKEEKHRKVQGSPQTSRVPHSNKVVHSQSEPKISFYHIENIGYQNYKYPKIGNEGEKPRKQLIRYEKPETIESAIKTLYHQKLIVKNAKKNVLASMEQKNNQEKNDENEENNNNPPSSKRITTAPFSTREESVYSPKFIQPFQTFYGKPKNAIPADQKQNLQNTFYFRKTFVPNFKSIITNKKASFKEKQFQQEFSYYSNLSKKMIEEEKKRISSKSLSRLEGETELETYHLHQASQSNNTKQLKIKQ